MAKKTKSKKSKSSGSQSSAAQFTSGSDVVDGTSKNDKFKAGDGADLVNGLGGNDKLYGGDGDDTLNGGDGKDQLKGDAGDDSLDGGAGNDKLWGGDGNDALMGGDGKDQLKGDKGDDTLDGGAGNDKLWGGDGDDLLQGGAGNDDLKGDKGNDTLMGGAGNDKLKGGAGDDVMSGGAGNDDLKGGDGNDQMSGDAGDDKMSGGAGDDVMLGGDGDDVMSGDGSGSGSGSGSGDVASFNDYLDGGAGNDWMQGNQGDDTVLGGEGDDVVIGDSFGSGSHFGKGSGKGSGSGSGSGDLWAESVQPRAKGSGSGSGGKKKGKGSGSGSGKGSGSGSADIDTSTFNDYLDGGAGNDIVLGMQGDDEARYGVTENAGASDKYAGGRGIDTLTLDMTHDEWFRADIQQDIADYLAFVAANTDPVTGEANSNAFQFQAFDLIAREFENLRVFVDGVETDPTDHTPVAVDDSGDVLEDDAAIAFGTVLANDDVQDLVQSITLVSGPAEGVLDFVEGTGGVQDGNGTLDQIGGRTVGSFTFDPNDDFEDLAVGETRDVSFTYEVTDADGDTTEATVTLTVTGQNDAPVISVGDSVLSGGVTEHADLSASENATSHNASGQVTFSDVDVSDTHTASFAANGTGYRGAFSVATPTSTSATTDGQIGWSFDIADADIDDLAAGQVLTQSYDVTVDDGNGGTDTTTVTVTITGTNDAPIIDSAAVDVALSESVAPASLNASGAITFSDVDTLDSHVVTRGPLTVSGEYLGQPVPLDPEGIRPEDVALLEAALVVDADGNWSFDVPVTDQIERLAEGMSITLTSLVTVTDDSGAANDSDTQLLTISITGTNDAPEILSSVTSGAVTEIADLAAGENSDTLSTTGTIAFRDIDQANVHTVSVAENGTGYRGDMSAAVTSATQGFGNQDNGVVDWQFDIADADIDDLAAGQTLTQSYTLTITDNDGGSTTETVTVTITGTNDAPVIETAPVDVTLTEGIAPTALSSSGVVTFSDVDTLDSHIVTRGPVTVSGTYQGQPVPYGPEGLRPEDIAMAEAALVVNADGSWSFDMPASELVDRMAEGQIYVITSEITVTDDSGAANSTDTQTLTITLIGTNDAPEITSAVTTGSVTEIADLAAGENVDTLETTGQITFSDLDQADVHTVTVAPNGGGYLGAMTAIVSTDTENFGNQHAGEIDWTFQVDDSAIDSLAQGQVLTQSYTVTVTDNNGASDSEVVTLTITGTNDAPVVGTADDNGSVKAEVIDPTVTVGTGDMKFHVEQYQGYSTNNLNTMQSIMANPSAYGVTLYEADADFIDFVDYPVTGYSATNQPWPAAAATGQTHYTGVNDFFFARITTDFDVTSAGNYTFRTYNDDGLYLFVDGNLVINDPNYHGSQTFTGTVNLSEGQHSLELFFFEHGGAAVLELSVADSSGNFQLMGQGAAGLGGVGGDVALTDGGSIAFSDVDLTDAHTVSVTPNGAGYLGDLTTAVADVSTGDSEGSVDWEFMVSNADLEYLAEGETVTQTYTVTITDNTGASDSQQVTITLTGTNEAPVIGTADTTASVTEIADLAAGENATSHTVDGSINFSDVDTIDTHSVSVASNGAGYRGSMTAIVADASTGDNAGRIDWTFAIDDSAIDDLAAGQVLTQSYTVTVDDGQGGTDTQTVTVTITGTNDAPVVAAISAPTSNEDAALVSIDLLSTASDVDLKDDLDVAGVSVASSDGRALAYAVDSETGAFSIDPSQYNDLAVGESETVTITYNVVDGNGGVTPNTATVLIEGRNDGPTATAINAGATHEDAAPINIDLLLTAADDDLSDDLDVANVTVASSDGRALAFSVDAETGAFSLDPSQFNDLAVGESETVTVTYDVVDGNGGVAANTASFVVEGRNDAPVFNTGPAAPIVEDFEGGATGWTNNTTIASDTANFSEFLGNFGGGDSAQKTFALSGNQSTVTLEFDVYEFSTWDAERFRVFADGAMIVDDFFRTDGYSPNDGSSKPYAISVTNTKPALPGTANYNTEVWHYTITLNTSASDVTLQFASTLNQDPTDESWGLDNLVITEDAGGAAAELSGSVTEIADGAVGENATTHVTDGSIAFGDVDLRDAHTVSATANGAGYRGTMTATVADASTGDGAGSIDWSFSIDDSAIDDLAAGQTLTQSYDITVDDGNGGTDTETVTVTITGTNDAPEFGSSAAGSVSFSGGTVGADTVSVPTVSLGSDYTLEAWVKNDGPSTYLHHRTILELGNDGPYFGLTPAGHLELWQGVYDSAPLPTGEWVHVAATVSGNVATLYVNGAEVATGSVPYSGNTGLGVGYNVGDSGWVGSIDEVRVWDVARSEAEIAGSMNGQLVGNEAGLTGYWTFNEETGTTAADLTGNGHTGYLSGAQFTADGFAGSSSESVGSVTEVADGTAGENATTLAADGSIAFTDVDLADRHAASVADNGAGYRGTMTATVADASTGDGAGSIDWSFSIDDSAIDDLAAGQTLTQSYDITVDDGQGGTDTETVTVTITGTNDAPVIEASDTAGAVIESGNLDDGTVVAGTDEATGTMVSSDVDNGATAVWSGDAAGTYGSFTIDANSGDWTYTLDNGNALTDALAEGQSETETFAVTVTDDQGATATETVSIIVTGTNDVPTASAITAPTTNEDAGSVSIDLLATAADVDAADDLDVTNVVVTSSDGRALSFSVDAETGAFSLDPRQYNDLAVGENATVTVSYDVIDSNGGIAANTATVLVEGRNDAPVAQAISGAVDEDAGQIQLSGNIGATSAPNLGRFYVFDFDTGASTTIARDTGSNNTYDQIAAQYLGSGNGIVAQVNPNNSGWGVASEVYVGGVGTPVDASQYSVTDTDGGPAAYQHGTYPEVLSVDDANKNVDQIALSLTGLTLSDGRVVDLDMNINGLDYEVNTTDDIAIGGVAFEAIVTTPSDVVTISADHADVDTSDTHTFSVDVSGTVGQVTNNNDGTFTYDANGQFDYLAVGETATDTFTHTVDDGNGGADTQTATITITGTNDAPTLQSNAGVLGFDEASATDSLARVVDGYGGFNWSTTGGIGGQSSAQQGDILASANGNAPSGPNAAWNGHASPLSIIEKTDGSTFVFNSASFASVTTATYGGELTSVTLTGYLNGNVIGTEVVNLGAFAEFFDWTSSLGAIDRLEITPQGPFNGGGWWAMDDFAYGDATEEDGAAIAIDLSAMGDDVDSDDDGTTLTYSIVTGPSEGSASITGTSLSFDPGSDFQDLDDGETRTVTIEVMATDSHGATATNTMSVVVGGVNDAPVAIAAAFSGDEDTNIAGAVAATDADGDALTYSVVTGPANGSIVMNSDGTFVYTPSGDYNGADSFTFIANDGSTDSAPQTVSLSVLPVNDAPTASDAAVSGNEDATITGTVVGADVDGDALTFDLVTGAANGTVTLNSDGTYSYAPNANFNGTDSFTFVANDGTENSFEQVVAITVDPVNDAPEASALSVSGNEDSVLNATVTGSDIDGDALTYSVVSGPTNGSVSMNADGTFSYTPGANYNGADSFTFRANDGTADSADQIVSISIAAVNDAPTASDAAVAGNEDTTITGTVVGADVDGDALTFDLVTGAANGTVTLNSDGTYSYAPNANFNGTDSFTFRSNDEVLTSAVQTVSITVNPVNDAPVAVADSATTDEDTAVLIDVLTNDTDVDGDTLSVTTASVSSGSGSVSIVGGVLSYDPGTAYQSLNAGQNATVTIDYTVSDGNGGSSVGSATVTVTGVNDGPPIANYVTLTNGNDTWTGQSGNQQVDALAGNDTVYGDFSGWYRNYYYYNDTFGSDVIYAGAGGDTVYGDGEYMRSYYNYSGSQTFTGGADVLYGQSENDRMVGDFNRFEAYYTYYNRTVTVNGGDDQMYGEGGNDTMYGDLDYARTIYRYGGYTRFYGGEDSMDGGDGADTMIGDFYYAREDSTYPYGYSSGNAFYQGGNDIMSGGAGNDTISGDYYYTRSYTNTWTGFYGGADTIEGGEGNDQLYGDFVSNYSTGSYTTNGGADVFVFNPNSGSDNIHDFQDGIDRLDVSGYGFTSSADMTIGVSGSQTYIQFSATDVVYLQSIFTITDDDFIF